MMQNKINGFFYFFIFFNKAFIFQCSLLVGRAVFYFFYRVKTIRMRKCNDFI